MQYYCTFVYANDIVVVENGIGEMSNLKSQVAKEFDIKGFLQLR